MYSFLFICVLYYFEQNLKVKTYCIMRTIVFFFLLFGTILSAQDFNEPIAIENAVSIDGKIELLQAQIAENSKDEDFVQLANKLLARYESLKTTILVEQNDPSGFALPSVRVPTVSQFTAEDFVVPAGFTWTITDVFAPGAQFGPFVASGAVVEFRADAGGVPGAVIASSSLNLGSSDLIVVAGDYMADITDIVLQPGTYWMSFAVSDPLSPDFATVSWGWLLGNQLIDFEPHIQIEDATGVVTPFAPFSAFGITLGSQDFALEGLQEEIVVAPIPTLGEWSLMLLVGLLMILGIVFMRERKLSLA